MTYRAAFTPEEWASWLRHPSNSVLRNQLPPLFPECFIRERNDRVEVLFDARLT